MEYLQNLKYTHEAWAMLLPFILMVLDVLTGFYNAWRKKEICSKKMRDGIGKKIAELSFIFIAILFTWAFDLKEIVTGVSLYIVFMEIISIIENLEKLGFPLPNKVKGIFNNDKGVK